MKGFWLALAVGCVAAFACGAPSSASSPGQPSSPTPPIAQSRHEPATTAPATAAPAAAAIDGPTASDALSWDDHVGWEPRHHFAPGERSFTRPEGSTLVLEYALGPLFEGLAAHSAGVALRDKPLIARHPAELCNPTLHDAVARLAPDRLLVHIDADLDTQARDCLARLRVADLFLSSCRHDGRLPEVDRCTDGDAQLALIAASDALRDKVRGLAIGFGDEGSWAVLTRFPRLAQLAVRGTALEHANVQAAFDLCNLRELQHVDALNAYSPGAEFPLIPAQCILGWRTFSAWSLEPLRPWLDRPSALPTVLCELERLFVERAEDPDRRTLEAACPRLRELEVMQPTERCERTRADEQMTCRSL